MEHLKIALFDHKAFEFPEQMEKIVAALKTLATQGLISEISIKFEKKDEQIIKGELDKINLIKI
ncbi:MAG: hypothetical protein HDS35_00550 [Bacteroides sp.]|nr:hypothetical protein [Bacteroides sp.]